MKPPLTHTDLRQFSGDLKRYRHATQFQFVSSRLLTEQLNHIEHLATLVFGIVKPGKCRRHIITALQKSCETVPTLSFPGLGDPMLVNRLDRFKPCESDIVFENLTVFLQPLLRLVHRRDLASDDVPESRRVVGLEQVG